MATSTSIYDSFKNYVLFEEQFMFKVSLYFIFNEQNRIKTANGELKFIVTYQNFKQNLLKLRNYAKNSCGIVCQSTKNCRRHQVLEMMQKYDDFIFDAVENRTLFYKHVKFVKRNNDDDPMMGFIIVPINEMDLGWKTWSERMRYLLI